jgi:hypothetical protein
MSLKFTGVFHRPNALSIYVCRQAGGENVKDWGLLFGSDPLPRQKDAFFIYPQKKILTECHRF